LANLLFGGGQTKFKAIVSLLTLWRTNMSKDSKFKNESQDARRHDQQHVAHPDEKMKKHHEQSKTDKKK
jgi:hypothetical protein